MQAIGIVAEYDPFHSGHRYHIAQARARLGGELPVICAMSGNWTQRGQAAVTDKWTRARLALLGGADLVLELPTAWASASAETFARGAVEVLLRAGADRLCFGSESGELSTLEAAAAALDTPAYSALVRELSRDGKSFARARREAAEVLLGPAARCLDRPNDNLAVEYLRAARRLGAAVTAAAVPRRGDGHDRPRSGGEHASAGAIRAMLLAGEEEAWSYLHPKARQWLTEPADLRWAQRAVLARLRSMTAEQLRRVPDCGEGLEHRLLSAAGRAGSLEELYALAKSKRYAHARIRRVVLRAFLGLYDIPERVPYLRVLGMTDRGREVLRALRGERVITKPAHGRGEALLEAEARFTDLYALCFPTPRPSGMEWRCSPAVLSGERESEIRSEKGKGYGTHL